MSCGRVGRGRRGNYLEDPANEVPGIQQQFLLPGPPTVFGAPVPVVVTAAGFDELARLTYVYEPRKDVPEPAGRLLMALRLGGLDGDPPQAQNFGAVLLLHAGVVVSHTSTVPRTSGRA